MKINIRHISWKDRILAAFIFFTRLPFWRIRQPGKETYETVVEHWPLTGWLTGLTMAAIIYFGSMVMPGIAVFVAIAVRILITGALHEDGLADFFDGFGGGGTDRKRILDIMKDSRIGTYGVLGLVLYVIMLYLLLSAMSPLQAALTVVAADPFCKMLTAQLIQMLPYARTEETAKNGVVYRRFSIWAGIGLFIEGCLPLAIVWVLTTWGPLAGITTEQGIAVSIPIDVIFFPGIVLYFLYYIISNRIKGYTGDCCGAIFLLVELSFYATVYIIGQMSINALTTTLH